MGIFRMFRFFEEAVSYAAPDEAALEQSGADARRHASFYRVIVCVSGLCGLLGAAIGVALIFLAGGQPSPDQDGGRLVLVPFMFVAVGLIFGVAVACALAPSSFLTSPVGQKWMDLIGTKNVLAARIVCILLALIIAGVPTALGLLILLRT